MISLNKVMLVGNLTRDPELRHTPNGKPVSSFGVATNRRWKNEAGELQEETEFHTVVVWGRLAEVIPQILKKGHRVFVEGRLRTRSWEGQDGAKRQRTEVVMENFIPLTPKGAKEVEEIVEAVSIPEEPTEKKATKDSVEEEEIDLDEIPF
jgi:single-strand DNA-binding protein